MLNYLMFWSNSILVLVKDIEHIKMFKIYIVALFSNSLLNVRGILMGL